MFFSPPEPQILTSRRRYWVCVTSRQCKRRRGPSNSASSKCITKYDLVGRRLDFFLGGGGSCWGLGSGARFFVSDGVALPGVVEWNSKNLWFPQKTSINFRVTFCTSPRGWSKCTANGTKVSWSWGWCNGSAWNFMLILCRGIALHAVDPPKSDPGLCQAKRRSWKLGLN